MISFFYNLIIYPITQLIELIYTFSNKIFKDPVISILFVSIIINYICLPLLNSSDKWNELERNTTKFLKSKIERIKAVFYGDERFMILQTLYRQNHYHPIFALRSTFGLLMQIPFFLAAFLFLSQLESIKGVPFLFIPSLSEPDQLITINKVSINFLPILMTILNLLSGFIYSLGFPNRMKIQLYSISFFFLILL